jgi:transcription elongation GreA/GreB family factor
VSRGFVKNDDDRPERPLPRPVDIERPNYVTPRGLQLLREALERAQAGGDARNAEYYRTRVETAEVVDPAASRGGEVAFGSSVVLRDGGREIRLRIVGEDEADPAHGTISWISPYAQALLGHRAGDRVVVARPAGAAAVVIESVA